MNPFPLVLSALLAITPAAAQASWFEYCDLGGEVKEVEPTTSERTYRLSVAVANAVRAKENGDDSYTDCTEHLEETVQVTLQFPHRAGAPAVGDHVSFYRALADCFGRGGEFIGQCGSSRFLRLRKPSFHNED